MKRGWLWCGLVACIDHGKVQEELDAILNHIGEVSENSDLCENNY